MAELALAAGFSSAQAPRTMCSQCQQDPAKYRCPGCSAATCSVLCVKAHKTASGCTGKRNRAEFVPITKFDDNQLVSDLRFLEDALLQYDVAKRTRTALGVRYEAQVGKHWGRMQQTARQRGVQLLLMPPGMSKRKSNRTYFQHRKRCIMWHVRWQFAIRSICMDENNNDNHVLANGSTAASLSTFLLPHTIDSIISEDEPLIAAAEAAIRQALKGQIAAAQPASTAPPAAAGGTATASAAAPPPPPQPPAGATTATETAELVVPASQLATSPSSSHPAASLGEVLQRLRLQLETPPSQLFDLDIRKTLRTQLAGRTILEFPSIRVSCLVADEESEDDESNSSEDESDNSDGEEGSEEVMEEEG
ncbi:unnamed protein product [Closterium sp. NIES-65]|nr:unnamed protein product [Closterium sp. NIES-65]